METLLEVQRQLARVAADMHPPSAGAPAPHAALTPVLIHIEQLLDEIRAAARAVVAAAHVAPDFRRVLEAEDVVDYESETETEDETEDTQSQEPATGKRPAEAAEDEPEPKRQMTHDNKPQEQDHKLARKVSKFFELAQQVSESEDQAEETLLTKLKGSFTVSTTHMLTVLEGGGVPSEHVAMLFRDASLLLCDAITKYRDGRGMTQKWVVGTLQKLGNVVKSAKCKPRELAALIDEKLQMRLYVLQEQWKEVRSNDLGKMQQFIDRVMADGKLEADQVARPLAKLACFFRTDLKTCTRLHRTSPRTEEEWVRFSQISEILAQWIHLVQQASSPPKLQPYLSTFQNHLNCFAKKNPGRVPNTLLE
ncbi:unnamed protein product [Phytophthora lilii]|uniref:Unnamed protein product n=1 Tax=Phytophthora lilii TaxID=2077276 RepID=A0A9W6TUY5_9STRA|nr:unnamed protein product [Phytophthora lilii]